MICCADERMIERKRFREEFYLICTEGVKARQRWQKKDCIWSIYSLQFFFGRR